MKTPNHIRLNYLDGIRGAAALLVVFGHFKNAFFDVSSNGSLPKTFFSIFDLYCFSAAFCVQLFFVLSGFVLGYNSFTRETFLRKQWTKRIFRLFAPVLITSLVYYLFSFCGFFHFDILSSIHSSDWISEHWQTVYTFTAFLQLFFYDFVFTSSMPFVMNINSALWTIPIEFYWSYVLFISFYLMGKLKNRIIENIIITIIVLAAIRFAPFKGVIYGVLFLSGALLARNIELITGWFNLWKKWLLFVSIIALSIAIEMKWLPELENIPFRWTFLAAMLIILFALVSKRVQDLFSISIFHWLGRISYSLYLLHLLVIGSLGAWLYVNLPFFRIDFGLFVLLAIVLITAFILSHLFTVFVDEPLMKFFDNCHKWVLGKRDYYLRKKENKIVI